METSLRQILRPAILGKFLANDYQRRPVRLPHRGARQLEQLVSLEEVGHILWRAGPDLAACAFRQTPDGQRQFFDKPRSVLADWLLEGYRQGMGIVITHAHKYLPSLAHLNRATEIEFSGRCTTTVVRSKASYEDLSAKETFILQVRGGQTARLRAPSCRSPLERQLGPGTEKADWEIELEQHDILYAPGGTAVALCPSEGSSLHVQLHIEIYRWVNLLEDMIETAAQESLALRKSVRDLSPSAARAALAEAFSSHTERLTFAAQTLRQRRLVAGADPLPGSLLTDPPEPLTRDAWIERVDGSLCHVEKLGDQATIEFAAQRLARVFGPAFIEPALRFIAETPAPFRVADLPAIGSLEEKLILANRLISEGLLRPRELQ